MTRAAPREPGDEVLVEVLVVPRASRTERAGWDADGRLRVRLAAAPVDGKANRELLKFLAGELGVPAGRLRVSRGETSRRKTVAVRGLSRAEIALALDAPAR
ncbi:MAG: DUF167 domain-containing protein [Candidatus Eiseniibacteriota bacterium]